LLFRVAPAGDILQLILMMIMEKKKGFMIAKDYDNAVSTYKIIIDKNGDEFWVGQAKGAIQQLNSK
jgi:hypothetical protein